MYDKGELPKMVDTLMEGDVDMDEACKFLRICLLCTQDITKLRPSMSKVVKLLTGEMDVDEEEIKKPGLMPELMKLKGKKDLSNLLSADSKTVNDSSSGNMSASYATMTYASIYDRSD